MQYIIYSCKRSYLLAQLHCIVMKNTNSKKFRYDSLYMYRFFRIFIRNTSNQSKEFKLPANSGAIVDIKNFLIKLAAIFIAVYVVIVLPLTSALKESVKGLDISLSKTSTKLMLVSLISNPETLYLLSIDEIKMGNKAKARMFIDTAIGILETHNGNPIYKQKFYKLRDEIDRLPDSK